MDSKRKKYSLLVLGILFDLVGMASYLYPGIGEFADFLWAPVAGWLMTRMYKSRKGQIAGIVSFVEELVPGLDIIPTFTLMWFYTYVFSKKTAKAATT
ncbi:hypothetical protein [Robertkochia aurantiaca]|uniref:hypothetical protein n=1 Tax=Robertkochia aurantiaca TaxID=2873700 RepID=UPI001CC9C287|nr:hypothetical protein [Robertkochia sp. 3YJGBD-33]